MYLFKTHLFSLFTLSFITVKTQGTQGDYIFSNFLNRGVKPMQNFKKDFMENEMPGLVLENVDIKLYYECMCPACRDFDTNHLRPTVEKLASYLNLHVYPYGKAQTIDNGNGVYEFKCQHGPDECYGNKLHACAVDYLGNMTKALFFNACMMEFSRTNRGSDDKAADECGKSMNLDPERIKQCAKGERGSTLLKYYGDESKKVGYKFVPYILINGVQNNGDNFMADVCAAFKTPPPECAQVV